VSKATRFVQFARGDSGHVSVAVPDDLQPLGDFFESDIGNSAATLRLVVGQVRCAGPQFAGDSCRLTVRGDDVVIENDVTGQSVTLPRTDFLNLAAQFERELF
jgi:hypothetical protein